MLPKYTRTPTSRKTLDAECLWSEVLSSGKELHTTTLNVVLTRLSHRGGKRVLILVDHHQMWLLR